MPAPVVSRVLGSLALGLVLLLGPSPPALAQSITYEYDPLGRLSLVSSPEGIARYHYDAVGNLLRIESRRYADTTDAVALLMLTPNRGPAGTIVTLYGKGFGDTPAANQVAVNGTPAAVSSASASRLTVTVPPGAISGPVTVTAPLGSATSLEPFTVTQQMSVTPSTAELAVGTSFTFQASLDGVPTTAVTWRVDGIVGGNATVGTITPAGVYTSPATLPALQPVAVEAVLTADPAQVATATVRFSTQPVGLLGAAPVAVRMASAAPGVTASVPVSVAVTAPTGAITLAVPISVAPTPATGAVAPSPPLSVSAAPLVTGTSPTAVPTGATGITLTITGSNLQGATAVRFIRTGGIDATLSASAVVPSGDGTSVVCTLTVSGSAALGARIVQIVTPHGTSSAFDLGVNHLTVTAP